MSARCCEASRAITATLPLFSSVHGALPRHAAAGRGCGRPLMANFTARNLTLIFFSFFFTFWGERLRFGIKDVVSCRRLCRCKTRKCRFSFFSLSGCVVEGQTQPYYSSLQTWTQSTIYLPEAELQPSLRIGVQAQASLLLPRTSTEAVRGEEASVKASSSVTSGWRQ